MIKKKSQAKSKPNTLLKEEELAMNFDEKKYGRLYDEISKLSQDRKEWARQDFFIIQTLVVSTILISMISTILVGAGIVDTKTVCGKTVISIFTMLPGAIISIERALNIPLRQLMNNEAHITLQKFLGKLEKAKAKGNGEDMDSLDYEFRAYQIEFEKNFPLGTIPKN